MKLKKILALMLALALSLTMLQGVAFGASTFSVTIGDVTIECEEITPPSGGNPGTAKVTKIAGKAFDDEFNVSIPQSVVNSSDSSTYTVTQIGEGGDTVRQIGALISIDIPATVTLIAEDAFTACDELTSVTFAAGSQLEVIGTEAFYECYGLKQIVFPDGLEEIGFRAFYGCKLLTAIAIPSTVTTIDASAFLTCSALKSVTFAPGSQLSTLGVNAFSSCKSLTSINLPDSVTVISDSTFLGCESLPSITIPAAVTTIEENAFGNCTGLNTITFEGGKVANIEAHAFLNAINLQTINLAGDYNEDMLTALAAALKAAANWVPALTLGNLTINYNESWSEEDVKQALVAGGLEAGDLKGLTPYTPPTTDNNSASSGSTGGSSGGAGAGVWYPGQASGGITYTQIVTETATTAMLETGSVITVTGQSPTGIIVKFSPASLSGHSTVTINNSIENVTLTATQIANLIAQGNGGVIHITIKGTPDGVGVTASAGGVSVTL